MAFALDAVIARKAQLGHVLAVLDSAPLISLDQGLLMLPITDPIRDQVDDGISLQLRGFRAMPAGFDRTLAKWSTHGPVVYVEAEYFGGIGEQTAAVWDKGHLVFGPVHEGENESLPAGSPISQALRHLGVERGDSHDEFDAVGLYRRRHTDEWITRDREA